MSAHDNKEHGAVEQLVAEYLKAEAIKVDGRAILDRARETRRRRVTWRRIGAVFAAAAAVVLAVTLGLIAAPGQPAQLDIPRVIRPIAQGGSTISNSFATVHASFASIRQSVKERFRYPVTTPSRGGVQPIAAQFRSTLKDDTAYMSGRLRTSISNVAANAGLTL